MGIEKRDLMTVQFTAADLEAQMRVKDVFDPNWLLNPAKVFPLATERRRGARADSARGRSHPRTPAGIFGQMKRQVAMRPASEAELAEAVAGRGRAAAGPRRRHADASGVRCGRGAGDWRR